MSSASARGFLIHLAAIILVLAACPGQAGAEPSRNPGVPVAVAPVEQKTVALSLELVGSATANRVSRVAAEVAGLVRTMHFKEGDLVSQGDTLVTLDRTSQRLSLEAARAALATVSIRLDKARLDLKRSATLKKARTISDQNYEKDLFNVRSLEQEVARAKVEVARITDRINRMTVRAPFTGFIIEQHTEVGQWLIPGAPIATLMDLSTIKVRVLLPERYLGEIKVGFSANVTFDAFKGETFTGRVSAIIPAAEEKSRNLPMEISLPNADGRIKAGLLARVSLKGSPRKACLLPKDALVLKKGSTTVFVVRKETVYPVQVRVGEAHGQQVEIFGKINPGQMVVVQGNERLWPGQKVSIISPPTSGD
ncbi:MAG: efflux RND transporter periplasmic adaptor subunit [Deltaproteobacteria bacterium]|nr:efflux RND transporter periplasmic adaptor subunit [Deltaproteobacteria bacterium]